MGRKSLKPSSKIIRVSKMETTGRISRKDIAFHVPFVCESVNFGSEKLPTYALVVEGATMLFPPGSFQVRARPSHSWKMYGKRWRA